MKRQPIYTTESTIDLVRNAKGFTNLFEMHQQELIAAVRAKTEDGSFMPLPINNGRHNDFIGKQGWYRISMIHGQLIVVRGAA